MKSALYTAIAMVTATGTANATDWRVVPEDSTLGIIGLLNGAPFEGAFLEYDTSISFDPDDPSSATIDVVIDTGSLDTDNEQRDNTARGSDLFSVAEYPTAQFTASGFAAQGDDAYVTEGQLTIRDVTQEVTLPFTLTINGDRAHAVGELAINRIDFGVGRGQWASSDPVAHEITVTIDIVAEATN
ncbi:MAG: YceI family protein [Pseudomonadota bacterium]